VQVVDDQHHRPGCGLVDGKRDQLLGQQRGDVGPAVGGHLTAQQPGDRRPPGIRRRRPHPERVEEGVQRQLLAELVSGAPEHLVPPLGPVVRACTRRSGGGRERGVDQGGLANPGLALDEHGVATASGEISQ
jgi:hypothetical protein